MRKDHPFLLYLHRTQRPSGCLQQGSRFGSCYYHDSKTDQILDETFLRAFIDSGLGLVLFFGFLNSFTIFASAFETTVG